MCIIPRSAHGTNPASAAMCGMETRECLNRRSWWHEPRGESLKPTQQAPKSQSRRVTSDNCPHKLGFSPFPSCRMGLQVRNGLPRVGADGVSTIFSCDQVCSEVVGKPQLLPFLFESLIYAVVHFLP